MRLLVVLLCAIWQASGSGLHYRGVTVGFTPYSAPVHSQFHAQNIYGQYMYGYATDLSAKEEYRTADGVTRGGYSYIDANGILQTVQYVSDEHGFRVVASNLPHDLPEVQYARAQHLAAHEHVRAEHAVLHANQHRPIIPVALSPLPVAASSPIVPVKSLHLSTHRIVVQEAAAIVPVSSQFHAQDGLGQYTYGYADPLSSKAETKTVDGVTRGGYSYIDANGVLQTVQYISDPVNGFRVAATNLPKAPAVTLIGPKVSTTVVGPKEHAVAVAPETNVVVAAPAPIPGPVYAEQEIVANAHIPVHGAGIVEDQYLQLNPNNIAQPVEAAVVDTQIRPHYNVGPALQQPVAVDAQYVEQPHYADAPQGVAYVDQSHAQHAGTYIAQPQVGHEATAYVEQPHTHHDAAYGAALVDAALHQGAYVAQPHAGIDAVAHRHHEHGYVAQPHGAVYAGQPHGLHKTAYVEQPHEGTYVQPHHGQHAPVYSEQLHAHQPQYLDANQAAHLVEQPQGAEYFAVQQDGAHEQHPQHISEGLQYAAVAPAVANAAQYAEVDRAQYVDPRPPTRGLLPPLQGPLPYALQGYAHDHHHDANPAQLPTNHVLLSGGQAHIPDHNPTILANPGIGGVPNSIHLNAAQEGYGAATGGYRPVPVDVDILEQAGRGGGGPVYARPETNDGSPESGRLALFVPERHFAQSADEGPVSGAPAAYLHHQQAEHAAGHGATVTDPKITGPTGYYTQNIQY